MTVLFISIKVCHSASLSTCTKRQCKAKDDRHAISIALSHQRAEIELKSAVGFSFSEDYVATL